jgi:hypothetical protein
MNIAYLKKMSRKEKGEMKLICSIDEIRRLGPEEVKEIRDNDKSSEF